MKRLSATSAQWECWLTACPDGSVTPPVIPPPEPEDFPGEYRDDFASWGRWGRRPQPIGCRDDARWKRPHTI